ncbi:MAG: hypothetical protein K2O36_05080 [Ruminococcus sp.]|nr:hypothetical protein [Ruminococcus sp.]
MNKKSLVGAVSIGVSIIILGVVILCLFLSKEYKKIAYGEEVQCTITHKSIFGGDTLGYYYDKNGNLIEAEIINVSPATGEICEGYVIPNESGKVYLKTSVLLYIGLIALSLVFIIGGTALVIYIIIKNADWNLISREGTFTTGEIVSIRYENAGKDIFYIANIRYVDENGEEHFFDDYSDKNNRRIGQQYTIGYAKKKNEKYTAKIM